MPNKKNKQIPDQSDNKKGAKKDYKIYPPRKEQDFVKINRDLHPFYASMFSKNGANLFIASPPSSGKTSYISNLLSREVYMKDLFDGGIFVCSPTINNDIGAMPIKAVADHITDEYSEDYAKNLMDMLLHPEEEDDDDTGNGLSCILWDDCMGMFKQNTIVGKMASCVRHMKSLMIFSNQRCVGIPSGIRANISHLICFNQPSVKEFSALVDMCSAFGGEDNFIEMYNDACNVRYGMLMLDFREMKAYKQIPDTGEIIELYSRYAEDGSINDAKRMTKSGLKNNKKPEENNNDI